ncbi:protein FAM167A-like [Salvelinus sp. IW2-2015]|uniref:protein FAM167A-like n=1 Tax=Salvelinus sp. IW2-2015 TaxID=2691554 RepID=UPI000CDF82FA|nr:protein FAM167B-like [Salvelinus alpinus]
MPVSQPGPLCPGTHGPPETPAWRKSSRWRAAFPEKRAAAPTKLYIESALAWLHRELMEMQSQDQALIQQLMDPHTAIQELKLESGEEEEKEE